MSKTLTVVWGVEGRPCPMARKVRIIDKRTGLDKTMIYGEPVVVPDELFYRRRIRAGDLAIVKEAPMRSKKAERATTPAAPAEKRKDD